MPPTGRRLQKSVAISQSVSLFYLARPPQRTTRLRSSVLAVFNHLHTVHEHMFHTGCVLMRFFEGGMIGNCRRIEHHDVGEHSFLEKSAAIESEICRRQSAQSMDRVAH